MRVTWLASQTAKQGFSRAALAMFPKNGNGDPYPIDSGSVLHKREFDLVWWPDSVEPEPIYDYNQLSNKANTERWTHIVMWQEDGRWTGLFLADDNYINEEYSFSGEFETPAL